MDQHKFGPAAGLEAEGPVADAGGDDEVRVQPPLMAVIEGVFADPLPHVVDGDELAPVGVAAEHQVRPGGRLGVKVVPDDLRHTGRDQKYRLRLPFLHEFGKGGMQFFACSEDINSNAPSSILESSMDWLSNTNQSFCIIVSIKNSEAYGFSIINIS